MKEATHKIEVFHGLRKDTATERSFEWLSSCNNFLGSDQVIHTPEAFVNLVNMLDVFWPFPQIVLVENTVLVLTATTIYKFVNAETALQVLLTNLPAAGRWAWVTSGPFLYLTNGSCKVVYNQQDASTTVVTDVEYAKALTAELFNGQFFCGGVLLDYLAEIPARLRVNDTHEHNFEIPDYPLDHAESLIVEDPVLSTPEKDYLLNKLCLPSDCVIQDFNFPDNISISKVAFLQTRERVSEVPVMYEPRYAAIALCDDASVKEEDIDYVNDVYVQNLYCNGTIHFDGETEENPMLIVDSHHAFTKFIIDDGRIRYPIKDFWTVFYGLIIRDHNDAIFSLANFSENATAGFQSTDNRQIHQLTFNTGTSSILKTNMRIAKIHSTPERTYAIMEDGSVYFTGVATEWYTNSYYWEHQVGFTKILGVEHLEIADVCTLKNYVWDGTSGHYQDLIFYLTTSGDIYLHEGSETSHFGLISTEYELRQVGTDRRWRAINGPANPIAHDYYAYVSFVAIDGSVWVYRIDEAEEHSLTEANYPVKVLECWPWGTFGGYGPWYGPCHLVLTPDNKVYFCGDGQNQACLDWPYRKSVKPLEGVDTTALYLGFTISPKMVVESETYWAIHSNEEIN